VYSVASKKTSDDEVQNWVFNCRSQKSRWLSKFFWKTGETIAKISYPS